MKRFVNDVEVELDAKPIDIRRTSDRLIVKTDEGVRSAVAIRAGDAVIVSYCGQQYKVETRRPRAKAQGSISNGEIRAPMPGQIVDVLVEESSSVEKGDKILVLEAMKTQQAFTAPFDGTVTKLAVSKGDQVVDGALLALIQATAEEQ